MGVAEPACKTSLISVAAQSPPSPRAPTTQTALYDAKVDQASPTQWTSGGSTYGAWRGSGAKKAQRSFLRGARSWPKASRLCSPKPKPTQSQNSTKFDWKTNILVYQGCTLQYWPDPLCWPKSTEIAKTFKGSPLIWLIQSNDKISFPVGDLSCSFSLK